MKTIKERLVEHMLNSQSKPRLQTEIMGQMKMRKDAKKLFRKAINDLTDIGFLTRNMKNRISLTKTKPWFVGTVYPGSNGTLHILTDSGLTHGKPSAGKFQNGDRVLYGLTSQGNVTHLEILTSAIQTFRGTFLRSVEKSYFVPEEGGATEMEIVNPPEQAKHLDIVHCCKLSDGRFKVVKVLGSTSHGTLSPDDICEERGIPIEFPSKVLKDAKKLRVDIQSEERRRLDLRNELIYTIDGADAKDLDDAISIEKLDNGMFRLGVHIADVSHFVQEDSTIDKEAFYRGTSVYFPGHNVPMLPRILSDKLCSLEEGIDKLTMSVFLDIDEWGNVQKHTFHKSIIRSKARLIYDDVSDYLEGAEKCPDFEVEGLVENLTIAHQLATILESRRRLRGAIRFQNKKPSVQVDSETIDVRPEEKRVANRIIESFMVAANEAVGKIALEHEVPFLFRTHPVPHEHRLERLEKYLNSKGYVVDLTEPSSKSIQSILSEMRETEHEIAAEQLLLESMLPASYEAEVADHFGLGSEAYSHFTSPIRRYPDLVCHRVLSAILEKTLLDKKKEEWSSRFDEIASRSSNRERIAEAAEKEVLDSLIKEWGEQHMGVVFLGQVMSLMDGEISVQLENAATGYILDHNIVHDSTDETVSFGTERYSLGEKLYICLQGVGEDGLIFKVVTKLKGGLT